MLSAVPAKKIEEMVQVAASSWAKSFRDNTEAPQGGSIGFRQTGESR